MSIKYLSPRRVYASNPSPRLIGSNFRLFRHFPPCGCRSSAASPSSSFSGDSSTATTPSRTSKAPTPTRASPSLPGPQVLSSFSRPLRKPNSNVAELLIRSLISSRLERLYGGKTFVGLRIPDPDAGFRQHIDVVLVTKRLVPALCCYL